MIDRLSFFVIFILPALAAGAIALLIIWLAKQKPPGHGEFFESDTIDKAKKDLESWQK